MIATHRDIKLTYPDDMPLQEAEGYCQQEIESWQYKCPSKVLGIVELTLDGDEVVIAGHEHQHITRTRRVSGYLSTLDHFSDHKRAEERDRVKHC